MYLLETCTDILRISPDLALNLLKLRSSSFGRFGYHVSVLGNCLLTWNLIYLALHSVDVGCTWCRSPRNPSYVLHFYFLLHSRAHEFTRGFLAGSVLLIFLVCFPITCLYVLSPVLCCPWQFSHQYDIQFVFTSSCFWVFFAHGNDQHILHCVFALSFLVLCILCWQFLWIVLFWLPLRYSLVFMNSKT